MVKSGAEPRAASSSDGVELDTLTLVVADAVVSGDEGCLDGRYLVVDLLQGALGDVVVVDELLGSVCSIPEAVLGTEGSEVLLLEDEGSATWCFCGIENPETEGAKEANHAGTLDVLGVAARISCDFCAAMLHECDDEGFKCSSPDSHQGLEPTTHDNHLSLSTIFSAKRRETRVFKVQTDSHYIK